MYGIKFFFSICDFTISVCDIMVAYLLYHTHCDITNVWYHTANFWTIKVFWYQSHGVGHCCSSSPHPRCSSCPPLSPVALTTWMESWSCQRRGSSLRWTFATELRSQALPFPSRGCQWRSRGPARAPGHCQAQAGTVTVAVRVTLTVWVAGPPPGPRPWQLGCGLLRPLEDDSQAEFWLRIFWKRPLCYCEPGPSPRGPVWSPVSGRARYQHDITALAPSRPGPVVWSWSTEHSVRMSVATEHSVRMSFVRWPWRAWLSSWLGLASDRRLPAGGHGLGITKHKSAWKSTTWRDSSLEKPARPRGGGGIARNVEQVAGKAHNMGGRITHKQSFPNSHSIAKSIFPARQCRWREQWRVLYFRRQQTVEIIFKGGRIRITMLVSSEDRASCTSFWQCKRIYFKRTACRIRRFVA